MNTITIKCAIPLPKSHDSYMKFTHAFFKDFLFLAGFIFTWFFRESQIVSIALKNLWLRFFFVLHLFQQISKYNALEHFLTGLRTLQGSLVVFLGETLKGSV